MASQPTPSPAPVAHGAKRWEYMTIETTTNYGVTKYAVNGDMQTALKNAPLHDVVNHFGAQGWELVSLAGDAQSKLYVFKRLTDKPYVPPVKKGTA
jgi:fructose/tagatose bisphosphate aldolase